MTIRSRRETITFKHPFRIGGLERLLPAGAYEVIADEETIESDASSTCRRIATTIILPADGSGRSLQMLPVGSLDLAVAQRIDASVTND
jgi:hypothetical protein